MPQILHGATQRAIIYEEVLTGCAQLRPPKPLGFGGWI